ncbi:MAG: 50S ribosomal protein L6 [Parvularculales bacterium]
MSRIGKKSVPIPNGVNVTVKGRQMQAKGPKGELSMMLADEVSVTQEEGQLSFAPIGETRRARAMWGMNRTLAQNMLIGVCEGFSRTLEVNGVGYRAQVQGSTLVLNLGLSHEIRYPVPDDIKINCPHPTAIVISGPDKQKVGQVATEIRAYRRPEPYKGKGLRYVDEYIFRKEGKKK